MVLNLEPQRNIRLRIPRLHHTRAVGVSDNVGHQFTCGERDCVSNRIVRPSEDRRQSLTRKTRRPFVVVEFQTYVRVTGLHVRQYPASPSFNRCHRAVA